MVVIVPYDPAWPAQFRALRDRAAAALGPLALAIEHVGSTAVPGLAAKPVIDMDVVVADAACLGEAIQRLATLGYVPEGDRGIPGRQAFRWPAGEARHHLYICPADSPALDDHRTLRDYLRAHPTVAEDYARLKRRAAEQYAHDREAYMREKGPYVDYITAEARTWAQTTRTDTTRS